MNFDDVVDFEGIELATADLRQKVGELRPWQPPKLPTPPPPYWASAQIEPGRVADQLAVPISELFRKWQTQRIDAFAGLSRKDLRILIPALSERVDGHRLMDNEFFRQELLDHASRVLPMGGFTRALTRLTFSIWPVPEWLTQMMSRAVSRVPRKPAWLDWSPALQWEVISAALSTDCIHRDTLIALADSEIPEEVFHGEWLIEMVRRQRVSSIEGARRLLALASGVGRQTAVTAEVKEATRAVVAWSALNPTSQLAVATALRQRIADPFGLSTGRWVDLEPERLKVRAWLAGEFLDIFFRNLVPTEGTNTTEERRLFWRGYSGFVQKLYLFVTSDMEERLRFPEVREKLGELGAVAQVGILVDGPEKALLWMILESSQGAATCIEYNHQGAFRHRSGIVLPPNVKLLRGKDARAVFADAEEHKVSRASKSWRSDIKQYLASYGIRP